jgi:dihydrodipicolinate synthase/N-acetylneuraminate lyase
LREPNQIPEWGLPHYNNFMLIEGVFAAVTTPFYPDERIYFRKVEANMSRYSRSLLAGVVVLGSTGEAPMLTDAETRDVLRAAAEATAPEKVLIAGIGRDSVKATVDLAEVAAEQKYDVVLVRTSMYYAGQMSAPAVLHYFRSVADRSPLPVLLYNIPKCVPYQIPIEVIAELAEHPNIIGIKDSSGSVDRIRDTVAATRSALRRTVTVTPVFEAVTGRMLEPRSEAGGSFVSAGDLAGGAAVASAVPAAACGGILALAACAPQACQEVYLAWKDHDLALAEAKQKRIDGPNKRIVGALGISGVKYACDFNGYYGGQSRAPLLPVTADEKAEIETLLAETRN